MKNSSTRAVSVPINLSIKLCFSSVNSPREMCYVAELILQHFRHFTYVTTHSQTLPSLYLRHSSFSNPSVDSPTSQFFLQPYFRFFYVTSYSLNSPGEPPMHIRLHLLYSKLIRIIIKTLNRGQNLNAQSSYAKMAKMNFNKILYE